MAPNLAAFEQLLNAQAFATGSRKQATVGSVTNDALVGTLTRDEIFVAGGKAESGGFQIQMRKADFVSPPVKLSVATVEGQALQVLKSDEANGVYNITAGDPTTEVSD